jgi:hypothetical protein
MHPTRTIDRIVGRGIKAGILDNLTFTSKKVGVFLFSAFCENRVSFFDSL